MREYLFRGKVIASYNGSDGKWVYGDLFRHGTAVQIKEFVKATFSVDPGTVGQFTELTDKNGVRIFEGDIVKTDYFDTPAVIRYSRGAFVTSGMFLSETHDETMTVIGNIHDNPELLREGN